MENNNSTKILLINPQNRKGEFKLPVLPLSLAIIAAYLRSKQKDIDISAIDAWAENIGLQDLENRVSQKKADIIGIYMASPRYDDAKFSIEACRRALPDSIIVAGGPHPSAVPVETLKDIPQLDICVVGEGERTIDELVKAIKNNSPLSEVDGLAFRNKNTGEIIVTKPREHIKNLDELPFPARDLFPLQKYPPNPPYGRKNWFTTITSRGCPFHCAFCSKDVFQDTYRAMSPQRVVDEIEDLVSKYRARDIQFYDDDFTMDMKRAEAICDEILKRNIKIRWSCITRVDLVTEPLLRKMKEAGCELIVYGVESGNQKILDSINKGFTIEQVIAAFEMTRKIGIATFCSFVFGLPGETRETIQQTFDLVKKLKPTFFAGQVLIVYPGSRLFKLIQAGKYPGKLRTLKEGEGLTGTFFSAGNYTVLEDNLTFEEQREIAGKAIRKFYLRPQYIIQSLINIRTLADLKYYLSGGTTILKTLFK